MNEREKQILYTIISHYIKTGESVGSRTIEKKYDIGVSSATIRNAMADLEDKGLIHKMHTSSGRVPTEEGYKYYIDELIETPECKDVGDINSYVKIKNKQIGMILENVTEMLAKLSNNTAISLEPSIENNKIKKIEIIHIDDKRAYVVAITDSGIVKTANLNMYNMTSESVLKEVTEYINNLIISNNYTYTLKEFKYFLENVGELDGGFSSKNDSKLRIANESSLLLNSDNIIDVIKLLEDKKLFKETIKEMILSKEFEPYTVNVMFGAKLGIEELKNIVLIFFVYEYGGEKGIVSVIGPHRMKYRENIQLLNYVSDLLKQALGNSDILKLLD